MRRRSSSPSTLVKQDSLPFNVDKAGRTPRPRESNPASCELCGSHPRAREKASFAVSDAGPPPKVKGAAGDSGVCVFP